MTTTDDDPVLARRARMKRLAGLGKRIGYSCLLLAAVAFAVGFARDFTPAVVTVVVVALVTGSVVLLPAIIVGYGVMAAEREERGGGSFH
ncbi:MAG TPA: hypothetical protein VHS52_01445 [Acidimicrobiales bacterium]|jgi:hypothetical protein|nr:hypothetical protein [Acidimicrobiales bacterium]